MERFRYHLLQRIKQVEKQNDKNGEKPRWNEKGKTVNRNIYYYLYKLMMSLITDRIE